MRHFTRRDFFKLSGLGLMGLVVSSLPLHSFFDDAFDSQEGQRHDESALDV